MKGKKNLIRCRNEFFFFFHAQFSPHLDISTSCELVSCFAFWLVAAPPTTAVPTFFLTVFLFFVFPPPAFSPSYSHLTVKPVSTWQVPLEPLRQIHVTRFLFLEELSIVICPSQGHYCRLLSTHTPTVPPRAMAGNKNR